MKNLYLTIFCLVFGLFLVEASFAQCTPGDSISCPDIENNGEVCPDTLPNAYLNQFFSQEFTILAPPEYTDSSSGITVSLHHLKINDVANLPPGLDWVSNAADSIFLVGEYYCVLMDGTPSETGIFPLHIVVDVFIPGILGSPPIYVTTVTDSTSLFIEVIEESGIEDFNLNKNLQLSVHPNPFCHSTEMNITLFELEEVIIEVYNLLGTIKHREVLIPQLGNNKIIFNGAKLKSGIYFCNVRTANKSILNKIVKTE